MAIEHFEITDELAEPIKSAPLFFVASVDPSLQYRPNGAGPVNLSPKGGVALHIVDSRYVAYLDYEGSGDETARAASLDGSRPLITICERRAVCRRVSESNSPEMGGPDRSLATQHQPLVGI